MKFLLVLLVVVVVGWLYFGRRRPPPSAGPGPKTAPGGQPQAMLACAHCGVHLPQSDVRMDAAGRPFCSEAHRLLGPR